jgi:hypothetical protein
MYIVILGKIFGSIYQNLKSLYTHITLLEQQNESIQNSPTSKKLWLFKQLQYSLVIYLFGKAIMLMSEEVTVYIRGQVSEINF